MFTALIAMMYVMKYIFLNEIVPGFIHLTASPLFSLILVMEAPRKWMSMASVSIPDVVDH